MPISFGEQKDLKEKINIYSKIIPLTPLQDIQLCNQRLKNTKQLSSRK